MKEAERSTEEIVDTECVLLEADMPDPCEESQELVPR